VPPTPSLASAIWAPLLWLPLGPGSQQAAVVVVAAVAVAVVEVVAPPAAAGPDGVGEG